MIVCVCANINTKTIQDAISETVTIEHVQACTGACMVCQLCRCEIEQMILESTESD